MVSGGGEMKHADKVMTDGRVFEHFGWRMHCPIHNADLVYDQRKRADTAYDVHVTLEDCNHAVVVPAYRRKK
jgi:hypothetical protein